MVKVADEPDNRLYLCPACGQCLQLPAFWSVEKNTDVAESPAPLPNVLPVPLWFLGVSLALTVFSVGMAFATDWGNGGYFKLIAILFSVLIVMAFAAVTWSKVERNLPVRPAATLELPADLPREVAEVGRPHTGFQTLPPWEALCFLVVGILALWIGAVAVAAVWHGHHDHRMDEMALIFPLAGIAAIGKALSNLLWRVRVLVGPGGMLHAKGGRLTVCRWDDVEAVYQWTVVYKGVTFFHCKVATREGQHFRFNGQSMERVDQLGAVIEQGARPHLRARLAQALDRDEPVAFGPLTVGRDGLTHRSKTLPWNEIASIAESEGHLLVLQYDKRRNWCKIALEDIPNISILLDLLADRMQAA